MAVRKRFAGDPTQLAQVLVAHIMSPTCVENCADRKHAQKRIVKHADLLLDLRALWLKLYFCQSTMTEREKQKRQIKPEKQLIFLKGWLPGTDQLSRGARANKQDVVPTHKTNRDTTTLPQSERLDTGTVPHRQSPDATEPFSTGTLFLVTRDTGTPTAADRIGTLFLIEMHRS